MKKILFGEVCKCRDRFEVRKYLRFAAVISFAAWLLCGMGLAQSKSPVVDPHGREIEDLIRKMTIDEKAGQLTQFAAGILTGPGDQHAHGTEMVRKGELGSILGLVGADKTNELQHIAVEQSRLHIPLIFGFDVIHGHRTIFPIPLGLAASFDPALIESTTHMAAGETRADGIQWVFSPMVDIARDARWGRIAESSGEDPYLGSVLARAYVRGFQGTRLDDPGSVAACVKHFAGYGASLAGRDYNTVDMSETQLRQIYLPPYKAAVDAGVATVMASFSTLNGVAPTGNKGLLDSVLRREWGFNGLVVSDWGAVRELIPHGLAADLPEAARMAIQAGTDMDMESDAYRKTIPQLVQSGQLSMGVVDEAVRRVLRLKYQMDLFKHPYADERAAAYRATDEKRALARKAAEESFVLLKNDLAPVSVGTPTGAAKELYGAPKNPLLPLDASKGKNFALIGPLGDAAYQMLGSWKAAGVPEDVKTLRSALQQKLGQHLLFARGTDFLGASQDGFAEAVAAARKSDVVIMALGEDGPAMTGEGASRTRLDLPGNQEELLEAVVATGKPVVLLVFSGRPLALPWAAQHVPAILEAWFPGIEAGPALTEILFGDAVPSGKLPVEFPYAVGQEPLFLAQLPTGRPVDGVDLSRAPKDGGEKSHSRYIDEYNEPVFPFGWGLSYTTFNYGHVAAHAGATPGMLQITVDLQNTGSRAADEVAQLYFRRRVAPVEQPVRELKGFQRVRLAAGEHRSILFNISQQDLAFYIGDELKTGVDGDLDFWVGGSSSADAGVQVHSRAGAFTF